MAYNNNIIIIQYSIVIITTIIIETHSNSNNNNDIYCIIISIIIITIIKYMIYIYIYTHSVALFFDGNFPGRERSERCDQRPTAGLVQGSPLGTSGAEVLQKAAGPLGAVG